MIEIKLNLLRSQEFSNAYQKLMRTEGLAPKVAYHIARVGAILETEQKAANIAFDALVKKWADFKNENGQTQWKIPDEKLEGWNAATKDFHDAVATIDKRKLLLSDLGAASLTPSEFLALEPVLGDLELLNGAEGV
jgi:hypothetical protein